VSQSPSIPIRVVENPVLTINNKGDNTMKRIHVWILASSLLVIIASAGQLFGQEYVIKPAALGWPMPIFTLPSYQGGMVSMSSLKGKNILLVFPRGHVTDNEHWCHICHYQYAELAQLENELQIRKKYNLEIVFVLPYGKSEVQNWVSKFPDQIRQIENWKNPPDQDKLTEVAKKSIEKVRALFPKTLEINNENIPTPFPILMDAGRTVSTGLGLFTTEWDNSKVDQNIPTVYIIDPTGKVQFKYISQRTTDRPNAEYLMKYLDRMVMSN
jgi:peroxiredoxin